MPSSEAPPQAGGAGGERPLRGLFKAAYQGYLIAAVAAGVVLIMVSAAIKGAGVGDVLTDVARDIGIGCVVSVIVVVSIEWRAGFTLRKEIATDALEAVYRRAVPPKIYDAIRDSVFRSDVLRTGWTLRIRALPHEPGLEDGVFLVEMATSYAVKNLSDLQVPFLVKGWLDLDVPIEAACVPRFTSISVDGSHWDDGELTEELAIELRSGHPRQLSRGLSMTLEPDRQVRFGKHVVLPRAGKLDVGYVARLAFRAPGSHVVSSQSPADGVEIVLDVGGGPAVQLAIQPLHPEQDRGLRRTGANAWIFTRAILPWQGFQIVSSVADGPPAA